MPRTESMNPPLLPKSDVRINGSMHWNSSCTFSLWNGTHLPSTSSSMRILYSYSHNQDINLSEPKTQKAIQQHARAVLRNPSQDKFRVQEKYMLRPIKNMEHMANTTKVRSRHSLFMTIISSLLACSFQQANRSSRPFRGILQELKISRSTV